MGNGTGNGKLFRSRECNAALVDVLLGVGGGHLGGKEQVLSGSVSIDRNKQVTLGNVRQRAPDERGDFDLRLDLVREANRAFVLCHRAAQSQT